jgi:UDP-2,3-diacylglucosamine pyrophosphatase LpxH
LAIKRKLIWPQKHSDVIQKILKKARKGTKVTFITGNHDEFLRPFVPLLLGNTITITITPLKNKHKLINLHTAPLDV